MADCLREKRISEKTHDGDEPYRYTCQKRLVEVGKDANGNDFIIRLLDTDEAPQVKASSVTESLGG
jgi:hypothetical protein